MKYLVLLAGCGLGDGSCIEEVILTYVALDKYGCDYTPVAEDVSIQSVNHLTEQIAEKRNILNVAGRITDEKFSMMSKTYEDEQTQLKVEIQTLQQEIEVQERQIENLEQFIQRVRKYEDLDELTPYALRELVKAIYIEAPDKSSGKRHQGIRISYDLVGFIPVEELLKQETA